MTGVFLGMLIDDLAAELVSRGLSEAKARKLIDAYCRKIGIISVQVSLEENEDKDNGC